MKNLAKKYLVKTYKTPLQQRIDNANQRLSPDVLLSQGKHDSLVITLNRAEKRNALSFAMMKKLLWLAQELHHWRDIRAVLLVGAGESFCAGIDLADLNSPKNLKAVAWELIKPYQSLYQRVCLCWQDVPMPVIAVLHGHCIGAGLQLALACDVRFATPDCQFAIMESKWGLVADMGLSQSALGIAPDVLKELAMTARLFDSNQAKQFGFVSHISDNALEQAENLLAEIANRSPDAVLASKRMINQMYQQSAMTLYQEKLWQIKLLLGKNQKLAVKKAKDSSIAFLKRQFN